MDKWISVTGRALSLLSSIFECILCARLVWFNVQGVELPCDGGICGKLESDIFNHPGGVYIGWYGLFGAALIAGLYIALAYQDNTFVRTLITATASIGAITSIGLIGHVYHVYHNVCPWCMTSAAAWFVCLAGWLFCEVEPTKSLRYFWLSFALLTLAASGLEASVEYRMRSVGVDLTSATPKELVVPGRTFCETGGDEYIVFFIDLDCPFCMRTLKRAMLSPHKMNCVLRFGLAHSDYSHQASLLLLSCPTVELRRELLSEILSLPDDMETPQAVSRIQKNLGLHQTPQAATELDEDIRLRKRLRIYNMPVLLRVTSHNIVLMDQSELK